VRRVVSYLRVRPAEEINELWASTRRREGTTAVESANLTSDSRRRAIAGGLAPVAIGSTNEAEPMAWVVSPRQAATLHDQGIPGWRLTVLAEGNEATLLDVLARTGAVFLRSGRSDVAQTAALTDLPAIGAVVSTFVDSIDDAVAAVDAGAGDLLLRGWDTESLGALRETLDHVELRERTALGIGIDLDEIRVHLDAALFTAYLGLVDGSGTARPRYDWAPGMDVPAPVPPRRLSAEWADPMWVERAPRPQGVALGAGLGSVLERSLDGVPPTRDEVELLFRARGEAVDAIAATADALRRRASGDTVTYVVNRNINYTNVCYFKCGFCAFSKGPRSMNLRGEPYLMSVPQVVERSVEAWERGATEVCLQGGIHPDFTGDFYVTVVEAIKQYVPDMHIHGFTPLEVWQGAETLGVSVADFLRRLRDAGLGTLPGTAAEILDDDVRRHLCPDKIRTAQWAHVMITAHELGLRSTSTMMFGHVDSPRAWANHFEVLRTIQSRTGGITEFVPLPFVHMGAPIYIRGRSRPGPTWDEVVLVHAVARIAFDGLIPNIQASWVKLGLDAGIRLLDAGCNDLGGTLMDETISRAAGAAHGTMMQPGDFEAAVRSIDRRPARRTTLYELVELAPDG
jgi:FO synthase